MNKRVAIIFIFSIILMGITNSKCESGQIDVNSASLEDLDKLYGIGPAKAQAIIDARPFENLDDLIRVNGIGEVTLKGIKEQNLACVNGDDFEEEKDTKESEEKEKIAKKEIEELAYKKEDEKGPSLEEIKTEPIQKEFETIKLETKSIKTKENIENSEGKNYAIYALIGFCVLIALLFFIKNKRYSKNEFG